MNYSLLRNNAHKRIKYVKSRAHIYRKKLSSYIATPERFFLCFTIFFGSIFVFLVPPMQVPDEGAHLFRAYAVSNLDFVPHLFKLEGTLHYGSKLPNSVYYAEQQLTKSETGSPTHSFNTQVYNNLIQQPLDAKRTKYGGDTSVYPPISYIPQAIGITVGKVFNLSPLVMIWLGRMANLVVWAIIGYFAIKYIPYAKWGVTILALNPVVLFMASSLSGDITSIGLVFMLFSLVMLAKSKPQAITGLRLMLPVAILGLLALTKPVNIVFAPLLFLVPVKKFKNQRQYLAFCLTGILLTVVLALTWQIIVQDGMHALLSIQRPGVNISPPEQLSGILHHPMHYAAILVRNYVLVSPGYWGDVALHSTFGYFGLGDTFIPLWTVNLYTMIAFLALLYQLGRGMTLNTHNKSVLLFTWAVFFIANVTAMYLYFTPVGDPKIYGVQGRYFIPGLFLIAGLFTGPKKVLNIRERTFAMIMFGGMLTVLGMTALKISLRYY